METPSARKAAADEGRVPANRLAVGVGQSVGSASLHFGAVMAATDRRYIIPCALGRHHRSRSSARLNQMTGAYISKCKNCGVAMRRVGPGKWLVCREDSGDRAPLQPGRRAAIWSGAAIGAVAIGLFAGSAAVETIAQARAHGFFGGGTAPFETDLPAPTGEEDMAAGSAMASAFKITETRGCSRVAANMRRGCLRYVQSLR